MGKVLFKIFAIDYRPVARGGSADPPLENQRSTFWNLAREIIKANNYKWLTIYLHELLCTKPPTKWLQNLLSIGGSGDEFKQASVADEGCFFTISGIYHDLMEATFEINGRKNGRFHQIHQPPVAADSDPSC